MYTNQPSQGLCPNTFTFKERPGATWKIIGFLISFCFQFALPHLRKTKGNIINMSSLVAQIGQPGAVACCKQGKSFMFFSSCILVLKKKKQTKF